MSRKHEKTQHALVGLGSAAFAAAVAFTQVSRSEFPERGNKVYTKKKKKKKPNTECDYNGDERLIWKQLPRMVPFTCRHLT